MCVSRGQPIYSGAHMRATDHTACCCTQIADHRAHNTPFSTYVTEVVCDFGAAPPQAATSSPAIEGMTPSKPPTRRRHATTRRQRAPHGAKPPPPPVWRLPYRLQERHSIGWRDKTRPTTTAPGRFGTKLSLLTRNGPIWRNLRMRGEFCTAFTTKNPSRENFVPNTRQS